MSVVPAPVVTASSRSALAGYLPGLRRYARALTGSQHSGDGLVAATLAALVADRSRFAGIASPRLGLFLAFQDVWAATELAAPEPASESAAARAASARLAAIVPLSRQALLLGTMEGFAASEIAILMQRSEAEVAVLIADAQNEIVRATRSRVLIIEDEAVIAMDIEAIVTDMGHTVTGIAATRAQALAMAAADAPGLVLADIQLRDGSSGIDAVREIHARHAVPAIFITGHPDLLSTGERAEPTFVIAKPFEVASVQAAIAQALFFGGAASPHG